MVGGGKIAADYAARNVGLWDLAPYAQQRNKPTTRWLRS
jgi:hypothetical protein